MTRSLLFAFLSLPFACGAACGGRVDSEVPAGSKDAGAEGSLPLPDGAPAVDGRVPDPPVEGNGYIVVQQAGSGSSTSVGAAFSSELTPVCALGQPSGSCVLAKCVD